MFDNMDAEDLDPMIINPHITENDDTNQENIEELTLNLEDFGLEMSIRRKTTRQSDHLTLTHLDENF